MVLSEEFILVGLKAPAWHGAVLFPDFNGGVQVRTAAVPLDAVILRDVIHFNTMVQLEGLLLPSMHCFPANPGQARAGFRCYTG